jgi:hypothetical protein
MPTASPSPNRQPLPPSIRLFMTTTVWQVMEPLRSSRKHQRIGPTRDPTHNHLESQVAPTRSERRCVK